MIQGSVEGLLLARLPGEIAGGAGGTWRRYGRDATRGRELAVSPALVSLDAWWLFGALPSYVFPSEPMTTQKPPRSVGAILSNFLIGERPDARTLPSPQSGRVPSAALSQTTAHHYPALHESLHSTQSTLASEIETI